MICNTLAAVVRKDSEELLTMYRGLLRISTVLSSVLSPQAEVEHRHFVIVVSSNNLSDDLTEQNFKIQITPLQKKLPTLQYCPKSQFRKVLYEEFP